MMRRRFNNNRDKTPQKRDENAIVLDVVLASSNSFKDDEIAQAIGTDTYTLLELVPKDGVDLRSGDKVYIGSEKRDEIQFIKRAVSPDDLSSGARSELMDTLMDIIDDKEEEFVNFFNVAGPITLRKHSLELVSGIGKKHLADLMNERLNKPFESFADLKERCPFLSNPEEAIAKRIITELEGEDTFKFFTRK